MIDKVEEKRNALNLQIRMLLSVIDIIDGKTNEYANSEINTLNEEQYLEEQIKLVQEAKDRLVNIFKD
ncbi:MAG: hypothetical protein E7167_03770 [Firmicutes bacterium]|nr:hypothetical protein [Bacillota bacterium]